MPTLTEKILDIHRIGGEGEDLALRVDQTLTQDATGTLAYLQLEALGVRKVETKLSVSYVDHNTLQTGYMNADDHRYLKTVASKYGVLYSRPGNGICHQVHLERFAKPGDTLLGADSHTPTAGGVGMLAIGAGGLDVALAMAGHPFHLEKPEVVGVKLTGELSPWVGAKDVILELLRRFNVKWGVGRILEYYGPGVSSLSVPERAAITNMGAELGLTTSIFPSDSVTERFLTAQGRPDDFVELGADSTAKYSQVVEVDLSAVEPLVARPHSPGNVVSVSEVAGLRVDQVCVGSCTNSSLKDLMLAAEVLDGGTVHPDVGLTVSPGSRQVLTLLSLNGSLAKLVKAGARILESACGPCIGMGQSPGSGGVSVRTFNRNFKGRSGTKDAKIYLTGVETAVASALKGVVTDPRTLGKNPKVSLPETFEADDSMIVLPHGGQVERGPNIRPLPVKEPLTEDLGGEVLIKVGDDVSTDHIMPAGAKVLPLRSNIPALADHVFAAVDSTFAHRARERGGGFIVAGLNYGQGSSREHAALCSMYLGVKAVIAKSFARIHEGNLVNFGILPLRFEDPSDHGRVSQGDRIEIQNILKKIENIDKKFKIIVNGSEVGVTHGLTPRERGIVKAGGLLNYAREDA
jgi:aconitate hydratase